MILAETIAAPAASSLGTWLIAAAFALTTLGGVGGIFIMRREYEAKTKELERRIDSLEEQLIKEREAATESRARLYTHVDKVRQELSDKMDGMPDRIVALLRNTGAIHS